MKIVKFERSGFIFETNSGFRLAIDIANKTPLDNLKDVHIDAMLVSHKHGDHFSLDQIRALNPKDIYLSRECIDVMGEEKMDSKITEVKFGDTIDIGDISVTFFEVDHGPNVSSPVLENFGFLIKSDGQTIYFAGDMYYPSGMDVSTLEVDFVLLPIGTYFTFGPQEAFIFARQFKKIGKIITMHYDIEPGSQEKFFDLAKGFFDFE